MRLSPRPLVERLQAYMIKAVKEAKLHTSWLTQNQGYENAVTTFVESVLTIRGFSNRSCPFQSRVAGAGLVNSLRPGRSEDGLARRPRCVPGAESLGYCSLVDPDNRRPVDFERRRQINVDRVLALDPAARAPGARRTPDVLAGRLAQAAGHRGGTASPPRSSGAVPDRRVLAARHPRPPSARRWSASCGCKGTRRPSSSRRASPRHWWISRIRSRSGVTAGRPRASCCRRS